MTRPGALLATLLLCGTACATAERTPAAFDADRELAAWVEVWRTYDLDAIETLFVWDSTVTYLSSEREDLLRGTAALREHHRDMGFVPGGKPAAAALWVDHVHQTVSGPTAVVTAVWYFGDRALPVDSVQRGPMTAVYRWSGDRYRIAHMHFADY